MLRNPSLLVQPTSGFVPFSGGGALDDVPVMRAPSRVGTRTIVPVEAHPAPTGMRQLVWEPANSMSVRRIEVAVLAAVCGYFTFGLAKLLGLM